MIRSAAPGRTDSYPLNSSTAGREPLLLIDAEIMRSPVSRPSQQLVLLHRVLEVFHRLAQRVPRFLPSVESEILCMCHRRCSNHLSGAQSSDYRSVPATHHIVQAQHPSSLLTSMVTIAHPSRMVEVVFSNSSFSIHHRDNLNTSLPKQRKKAPTSIGGGMNCARCSNMLSCSSMLIFGMDKHNIVTSPGVERASTSVERKATATEPSGPVVSFCEETRNRHPQPTLRR